MNWRELQLKIISTAKNYVGMQEIKGNLGWTDSWFEEKMEQVGWKATHAWCAYFTELVWSEVYDEITDHRKKLDTYFSGSATRTYRKFKNAGWEVGKQPLPGAVVIWCNVKNGEEQWTGHAGIVTAVHDDHIETVEGNTNAAGSREGEVVAEKTRKYKWKVENGLQLVGFIYPPNIVPVLPFQDKSEGNAFRRWINIEHPDYAAEIDLDESGSFHNSYIKKAWIEHGHEYMS
jgi:hypothetical protein